MAERLGRRLPTFSQYLRAARAKRGLSLRELSERSGVSVTYIHQIEHGNRHVPSDKTLHGLCTALRLDYDYCCFLAGQYPDDLADGASAYPDADQSRVRKAFNAFRRALAE